MCVLFEPIAQCTHIFLSFCHTKVKTEMKKSDWNELINGIIPEMVVLIKGNKVMHECEQERKIMANYEQAKILDRSHKLKQSKDVRTK